MKAAVAPRSRRELRLLVVDGARATAPRLHRADELPSLLGPGDVVVVNDAATLPASIAARTREGEPVELRLVGARGDASGAVRFTAALLGAGDHRTPTEHRPAPPPLPAGTLLSAGPLSVEIVRAAPFTPRLVDVGFRLRDRDEASLAEIWAALYVQGRPVQYAHVPSPLALWDVQNAWAARPWAVEMPSAGRALSIETLVALRARDIAVARVTHAAGLSATGDPAIDARLPLPERFEVPEATARAIARARSKGGRVVAVGTSVVRALESAARLSGRGPFGPASGITGLVLGPGTARSVVDAVLTGVHEADTTHFALLGAFVERPLLDAALDLADRARLLGHEFGDTWLVWDRSGVASATVAA